MKQLLKKSLMLTLCVALMLLLVNVTAIEARAEEGRAWVDFESFEELKEACKESYPNGVTFSYTGQEVLEIKESLTLPKDGSLSAWSSEVVIPKDVTFEINSENYGSSIGTLKVNGVFNCYGYLSINTKLDVQGKITASGDISLSSGATYSGLDKITFINDWSNVSCSTYVANYDELKAAVAAAKNDEFGIHYNVYLDYSYSSVTIEENLTIPANCSLSLYNKTAIIPQGVTLTVKGTDHGMSVGTLTVKGTLKTDCYLSIGSKLDVQGKIIAGSDISLSSGATYSGLDKITFTNDWNHVSCSTYVANFDELKAAVAAAKNDEFGIFYYVYPDSSYNSITIEENLTIPANCNLSLYDSTMIIPKGVTLTVKGSNYGMPVGTLTVKGTLKTDCHINIKTKLDVQGKIIAGSDIGLDAGATCSGLDKITFTNDWNRVVSYAYVTNFDELKAAVATAKNDKSGIHYSVSLDSSYSSVTIKENLAVPANCSLNLYDKTVTVSKGVTFTVEENNYNSFQCKSLSVKGTFNCNAHMYISKSLSVTGKLNAGSDIALDAGASVKGMDKIKFVNGWGQIYYSHDVSSVTELKKAISAAKEDESGIHHNIYFYTTKSVSLNSNITIPKNAELQLSGSSSFTIPSGKKLTVKGNLELGTKLTVKGTLVNDANIYVYGTNWNTGKNNSLIFSDGKYSGNGRMYVYKHDNKDADKYTDIVKKLSKTDLEVTENDNYWILRNINGLKKLSKPTGLTWGYTMQYSWNAKTKEGTYTLTERKGDFIWNAGSNKEKGVDYQQYKICVYCNDKLVEQYTRSFGNEYLSDNKNMFMDLSTTKSLKSGKYYFTVQAIAQGDDYCNSAVAKSATWTYKRPESKMKKVSELSWSFPTLKWSGPSGHELYNVEIYYAKTKKAEPVLASSFTMPMKGEYKLDKDDLEYFAKNYGKGYYSFRVRTLSTDISKKLHASWSSKSASVYFDGVYSLSKPSVTATNASASGKIKLEWKKVDGAEQYQIYRATSKDGKYTKIKTTSDTSFVDKTAKAGTKYYYKVRAVSDSGLKSSYSSVKAKTCKLPRPVVTAKLSSGKVKLTWEEVEGATKYEVYRATSKDGEYKKVATTTNLKYTDSSVKNGKTYYYKVKAVHKNTAATSAYSSVDSVKVKK